MNDDVHPTGDAKSKLMGSCKGSKFCRILFIGMGSSYATEDGATFNRAKFRWITFIIFVKHAETIAIEPGGNGWGVLSVDD